MPFVAVVYYSHSGHTAAQARAVCEGALEVDGVASRMIFTEDAAEDPSLLDDADALIFGSCSRMGGVSAQFKGFMETTGRIFTAQAWKDRLAAGFTTAEGLQEDELSTIEQLMGFAMRHGMIWISLGLLGSDRMEADDEDHSRLGAYSGATAQSNIDGGIAVMSDSDLATAKALGRRVAEASLRWEDSRAGAATR